MTSAYVEGHWPKIIRAEEHLAVLRSEIDYYREGNACRAVGKFENEDVYVVRIERGSPPSPRLALLIGECFAALRSALDHLAFALVGKHNPRRVTDPRAQRSIQFPIYTRELLRNGNPREFAELKGLPAYLIDMIKSVQPYKFGDDAASHPLAIIDELNNRDKHRQLMLTGMQLDGIKTFGVRCRGVPLRIETSFGPAREGEEVARFDLTLDEVRAVGGRSSDDLEVFAMAAMQVTFDETGATNGRQVLEVLDECLSFVRPMIGRIASAGGTI